MNMIFKGVKMNEDINNRKRGKQMNARQKAKKYKKEIDFYKKESICATNKSI